MKTSVMSITDFFESTTSHGVSRIYKSDSLPMKLMWTVFLTSSLVAFSYHMTQLFMAYKSTPVLANIYPGAVPFQAPDITVCAVSPISLTANYETFYKHQNVFQAIFAVFKDLLAMAEKLGVTDYDTVTKIAVDMYDLSSIQSYFGNRQDYFIVKCVYKGFNCSFMDFKNFFVSKFGSCYRFVPSDELLDRTQHIEEFSLDLVLFTDNNPAYFNTDVLKINGRLLSGVTFEGSYQGSLAGGAILLYGEKEYYPRNYINLSPGTHSFVQFEMVEYNYVSRISKQCRSDNHIVYYEDYTEHRQKFAGNMIDCQYRKLRDLILSKCGCISSKFFAPYTTATEVVNGLKCSFVNSTTNAIEFKFRTACETSYVQRKSSLFNQMTECVKNCRERIYSRIISTGSWPIDSLAKLSKDTIMQNHLNLMQQMSITIPDAFYYYRYNLTTIDKIRKDFGSNFAQISIRPHRTFSTMIKEVETYLLPDLFSDIGGILGLYLGMSVLTMCELFDLVLVLAAESRMAVRGYKQRVAWRTKSLWSRDLIMTAATQSEATSPVSVQRNFSD